MSRCEFNDMLEVYHDGELDSAARAELESHLEHCNDCQKHLQQLQAMSRWVVNDPPRLSQMARYRLHQRIDVAMERGLLRFAGLMSGIAASVLLVGSAWLMRVNDSAQAQVPAEAPPWVSVVEASSHDPLVRDAVSPAAQWYLADASGNEGIDNR